MPGWWGAERRGSPVVAEPDNGPAIPRVVTGGRLGSDAKMLLRSMADHAVDPQRELTFCYRAVSAVLQDGVARQLLSH